MKYTCSIDLSLWEVRCVVSQHFPISSGYCNDGTQIDVRRSIGSQLFDMASGDPCVTYHLSQTDKCDPIRPAVRPSRSSVSAVSVEVKVVSQYHRYKDNHRKSRVVPRLSIVTGGLTCHAPATLASSPSSPPPSHWLFEPDDGELDVRDSSDKSSLGDVPPPTPGTPLPPPSGAPPSPPTTPIVSQPAWRTVTTTTTDICHTEKGIGRGLDGYRLVGGEGGPLENGAAEQLDRDLVICQQKLRLPSSYHGSRTMPRERSKGLCDVDISQMWTPMLSVRLSVFEI